MSDTASKTYWEMRYQAGGTSGAGSYGRLADYKARFINAFVAMNGVGSVIEFGSGDGNQLSLLELPEYVGVDVSPTTLQRCRQRFADVPSYRFVDYDGLAGIGSADLSMSIDVLFHLPEDAVYETYLRQVFLHARRYVLIYSSSMELPWPAPHVRHRPVVGDIARRFPEWRLAAHVPNVYPFEPFDQQNTSFADFFVYVKPGETCRMLLPAADR